jgi:hypothetical protein
MIDLSRIRTLKPLETIKKDLTEFLAFSPAIMIEVYSDNNWGPEDYEADKEQVQELLDKVERRIKSLSNHLNKQSEIKAKEL